MRVATYSQPATATRGSVFAWVVLVLTVLVGTSALHSLVLHFAPQLGIVTASILWLLLYMLSFLGLMFSQGINWISWMVRYRILLVILLLGTIASVGWSVDAALSAERTVHLLGSSVVAIYLGFMVPLLTILRISAGVLGFIMVASLLAAFGLPELGIENYEGQLVWRGIVNSKNSLGFWSAVSVLLFLTLSDSAGGFMKRMLCYVFALISLFVLLMSDSATSLLAMVVAGSLSLYLYLAFRFQLGFARMTVMAVLFIGLVGLVITNIDTAELLGRSGDLTGRGEVWAQTWKLIMKEPLMGYGYGALWFPNDESIWIQQKFTDFTWVVYHAHNGFLQVASEVGLPLSVIALLMVVQQLIEIFYCQYERQQVGVLFVLAFVIAYLISNFSEARFLVNRELYWIFFLALPISMLRQITLVTQNPYEWDESEEIAGAQRPPGNWPDEEENNANSSVSKLGRSDERRSGRVAETSHNLADRRDQDKRETFSESRQSEPADEPTHESAYGRESDEDFGLIDSLDADDVGVNIALDDETDIDLGEALRDADADNTQVEDPHDRVIHPEDEDLTGLDHFDDFDDDQYDRMMGDDDHDDERDN